MTDSATDPAGPVSHIREHIELIEGDLTIMRRGMSAPRRVLDIGAGPATFVRMAQEAGYDALALDIEVSARAVWSGSEIPGILADGFHLPFRNGVFDVVRIKEVIEHVEDPLALLRAASGVLTDRGHVIAHVPSPYSQFYPVANFWDDYTHVRPLTRRGLERLFADAGFRVIGIRGYVAGRNAAERLAGAILGRFAPHSYRIVAAIER